MIDLYLAVTLGWIVVIWLMNRIGGTLVLLVVASLHLKP